MFRSYEEIPVKTTRGCLRKASTTNNTDISRREFLTAGKIAGIGLTASMISSRETYAEDEIVLSFGLVADLHYADKEPWRTRIYRDSAQKLRTCIETFRKLNLQFIVELGDIIDKADWKTERKYLETINYIFKGFKGKRYYVLGNHDLSTFSKSDFIGFSGAKKKYYSVDYGEYHIVILDANYNNDGSDYDAGNFDWTETYIHSPQQLWLKSDLEQARTKKIIVFVHQNLHDENDPHGVKNAPEIRRILEDNGNVIAVFQGHDHRGGYSEINGIHYVTLRAAVEGRAPENNAFAVVRVYRSGRMHVEGYGQQKSFEFT